jgi:hypothetical protein
MSCVSIRGSVSLVAGSSLIAGAPAPAPPRLANPFLENDEFVVTSVVKVEGRCVAAPFGGTSGGTARTVVTGPSLRRSPM